MSEETTAGGVRCMVMRGGTSKGAYFLRDDLPADPAQRDDLLLRIVGSPDPRQIDGIGGAHPLTTKVAVVGRSADSGADVEYMFLQPSVDEAVVSDSQNCGNLLAGVGPFAVERDLIRLGPGAEELSVRIRMLNTDSIAEATFAVRDGHPVYDGNTAISGVPGTAAPVRLDFEDIAGGTCGALLPSGSTVDRIAGVDCTLVDNGMPVVVMSADAMGISGYESCAELEADERLRGALEEIRLTAGEMMGLGDVTDSSVPKLTMVAPPKAGGALCTRTFIPHRCHDAIGVLGAVSVATAALLPGTPAAAVFEPGDDPTSVVVEHPTGSFEATVAMSTDDAGLPRIERAGIVRTARKLMDGTVFPRSAL